MKPDVVLQRWAIRVDDCGFVVGFHVVLQKTSTGQKLDHIFPIYGGKDSTKFETFLEDKLKAYHETNDGTHDETDGQEAQEKEDAQGDGDDGASHENDKAAWSCGGLLNA